MANARTVRVWGGGVNALYPYMYILCIVRACMRLRFVQAVNVVFVLFISSTLVRFRTNSFFLHFIFSIGQPRLSEESPLRGLKVLK